MAAKVGSAGVATGTTSLTPVYGQSPTAGNTLVMYVFAQVGAAATSLSVPTPSGWTLGLQKYQGGTTNDCVTTAFYKTAAGGDAAPSVTLTPAGGGAVQNCVCIIEEFSGLGALDVTGSGGGTAGTASANVTMATTNTQAPVWLIAGAAITANNANATHVWSGGVTSSSGQQLQSTFNTGTATGTVNSVTTTNPNLATTVTGGLANTLSGVSMTFVISTPASATQTSTPTITLAGYSAQVFNQTTIAATAIQTNRPNVTLFSPVPVVTGTPRQVVTRISGVAGSTAWTDYTGVTSGTGSGGTVEDNPFDGVLISGLPVTGSVLMAIDQTHAEWKNLRSQILAVTGTPSTDPPNTVLPEYVQAYFPSITGPWDANTGMFNWRPSGSNQNAQRTKLSVAQASTQDVHHVFVGDSITAAWNSFNGITGTSDKDKSWPYYYRRSLEARLGLTNAKGGTGLVRALELYATGTIVDPRWNTAINPLGGVVNKKYYVQLNSPATLTFDSGASGFSEGTGTCAALVFIDGPVNVQVRVDGGSYQTITCSNSGAVRRYEFTGLANTTHTLQVKPASGNGAYVVGAEVYTKGKGVQPHVVAEGGSGALDASADTTTEPDKSWAAQGTGDTTANSMGYTYSRPSAYNATPSTVFIEIGGNDLNNSTDSTHFQNIVNATKVVADRYKATTDVVLIAICNGSSSFYSPGPSGMREYWAKMYKLAYDNNWALWDWQYFLGGFEKLQEQGLTGDNYGHMTPEGYALIGQTMAGIVAG